MMDKHRVFGVEHVTSTLLRVRIDCLNKMSEMNNFATFEVYVWLEQQKGATVPKPDVITCPYCGKKVVLYPSVDVRDAVETGESPLDYK